MKIDVSSEKDTIEGGHTVYINLEKIRGSVNLTNNSVFLVMNTKDADKLAFHINSCLQDIERAK